MLAMQGHKSPKKGLPPQAQEGLEGRARWTRRTGRKRA